MRIACLREQNSHSDTYIEVGAIESKNLCERSLPEDDMEQRYETEAGQTTRPVPVEELRIEESKDKALSVATAQDQEASKVEADLMVHPATQAKEIEQLARQLVAEAPQRKQLRQRYAVLTVASAAATVWSAMMTTSGSEVWANVSHALAAASTVITLGTIRIIMKQLRDHRLHRITTLDDVRMVGPLLDVLESSQQMWEYDDPSRRAIKATLTRLLPRLQVSDIAWLTADQRAAISRLLYYSTHRNYPWHFDDDLALACLKALEQVGGSQALPYVEELSRVEGRHETRQRIRQAALECLPFLRERDRAEQAAQTLMRASQIPIDPQVLVRPMGAIEPRTP
jgi:hypothetical protein